MAEVKQYLFSIEVFIAIMILNKWDLRLLRNLYAGQEATVRTGHRTTDWFQIGKGVHQGCMYIATLLIQLLCRVHHEKRWAGRSTSWNQDCWEKYQ